MPNYGFAPNFFMSSHVPNYRQYYGSVMSYSSQAPSYFSTSMGNIEHVLNVEADEFSEFSIQLTLGGVVGANEATLI